MSSAAVDREPCAACNGTGVHETRGGRLEAGTYQPCPTCRGYGHAHDDDEAGRSQALRLGLLGLILVIVIGAAVLLVVVN